VLRLPAGGVTVGARGLRWLVCASIGTGRLTALLAALAMICSSGAAAEALQLARMVDGRASLTELSTDGQVHTRPLPPDWQTPLGSLWKLYVHAYLIDNALADPGYQCAGQHRDEVYCCQPGERIDRDQALVRSCGLYYAPARLGLDATAWRNYWAARQSPSWLRDLAGMRPSVQVPVAQLLSSLSSLPRQTELRRILLDVSLTARDPRVIGQLGASWRVKTWSWYRGDDKDARIGGFAGWLVDGTPVFASGEGSSQSVLSKFAKVLRTQSTAARAVDGGQCVEVQLFTRYAIAAVEREGIAATAGTLRGSFDVRFENGNRVRIDSTGELLLVLTGAAPTLIARVDREEYVARVLDREAAPTPAAAADALAIAIRSYLQQNAVARGDCLAIDDSSAKQRMAPRAATAAARAVAARTADLVLSGTPVRYHHDRADEQRLSWLLAVDQANAGADFQTILMAAFPRASLSRWDRPTADCQRLTAAERWLQARIPEWRERLDREPGYQEVRGFSVCKLNSGRPHTDYARQRIHVRGPLSLQDRLDLAHEYLHLGFANHPRGRDEAFVEALARHLILE